jgi:hypothetical protein
LTGKELVDPYPTNDKDCIKAGGKWTVYSKCEDAGFGQQGGGENGETFVNGTCGLDQNRRGDEDASYGGYDAYGGSYGAYGGVSYGYSSYGGNDGDDGSFDVNSYGCQMINVTEDASRFSCELLRDDNGFELCDLNKETVEAGTCTHPARSYQGSGDAPAGSEVNCNVADDEGNWGETDCTDVDGCHFEPMHCQCADESQLPDLNYGGYAVEYGANDGTNYGGNYGGSYGGSYGGAQVILPITQFQCAAAPRDAGCKWVEAGQCSCEDELPDGLQASAYTRVECIDNALAYTCTWYGQESCQAKIDKCTDSTSEGECGADFLKDFGCEYTAAILQDTCDDAELTDEERCARFSGNQDCDSQTNCKFQETQDEEQQGAEEVGSGEGLANEGSAYGSAGDALSNTNSECFRDPFACCSNQFDADSCVGRNDKAGDRMCAYVAGQDNSYCGGALCEAQFTLGADAASCPKIDGCQWISFESEAQCTFVSKCSNKNKEDCEAIAACQYGDSGGRDQNCQRKEAEVGSGEGNGLANEGSAYGSAGDGLSNANSECFEHNTKAECKQPLDDTGAAQCTWVATDKQELCVKSNKCAVSAEQSCTENGCQWSEKFDYDKGGVVGECGHPKSTFNEDGNYTCAPHYGSNYESSYGGYGGYGADGGYGGDDKSVFFGYDSEHLETTVTTKTATTKTTVAPVAGLTAAPTTAAVTTWTQADLTAATTMGSATACYYAIFVEEACTSDGGVYLIDDVSCDTTD